MARFCPTCALTLVHHECLPLESSTFPSHAGVASLATRCGGVPDSSAGAQSAQRRMNEHSEHLLLDSYISHSFWWALGVHQLSMEATARCKLRNILL